MRTAAARDSSSASWLCSSSRFSGLNLSAAWQCGGPPRSLRKAATHDNCSASCLWSCCASGTYWSRMVADTLPISLSAAKHGTGGKGWILAAEGSGDNGSQRKLQRRHHALLPERLRARRKIELCLKEQQSGVPTTLRSSGKVSNGSRWRHTFSCSASSCANAFSGSSLNAPCSENPTVMLFRYVNARLVEAGCAQESQAAAAHAAYKLSDDQTCREGSALAALTPTKC